MILKRVPFHGQYYKTMILDNFSLSRSASKVQCKLQRNLQSQIMIAKHLQYRQQKNKTTFLGHGKLERLSLTNNEYPSLLFLGRDALSANLFNLQIPFVQTTNITPTNSEEDSTNLQKQNKELRLFMSTYFTLYDSNYFYVKCVISVLSNILPFMSTFNYVNMSANLGLTSSILIN